MVRYLSTELITKANFVIFGGLKRYKGGLKSNLLKNKLKILDVPPSQAPTRHA